MSRSTAQPTSQQTVQISAQFDILGYPNGGYLASLATSLMAGHVKHPDALTVSASFLGHPKSGEAQVTIDVIDVKKSLSRTTLKLEQGGENMAFYVAAFTSFERSTGATRAFGPRTPPVPWSDCVPIKSLPLAAMPGSLFDRFEMRLKPGHLSNPGPTQPAEIEGWIELADGSPPSLTTLILFADAFPPPIFNAIDPSLWGSVPTVEYSVHLKAMPRPGPVHGRFWTHHLVGGYLEIDGELRDVDGALVAVSRQIAKFRSH